MSKKFKIIYISEENLQMREMSFSKATIIFLALVLISIFSVTAWYSVDFLVDFSHNSRLKELSSQNKILQSQLLAMTEKIKTIQQDISKLQKSDDELRVMANLDKIDEDTRNVGIGGTEFKFTYQLEELPDRVQDIVGNNLLNLEKLERQIKLETESQKELFEQFKIQQELVKHWPAIHPLEWNGKITGKFGRRIDPFTGFLASHKGIDISIDKGTPIYSTGDGVVVFADKSIGGYGKLIRISHSNGLETWFGHLSKIDVRKGQRIKRGQKIGEVGSSGRSTAPHLHYEIRYNNKPQNPLEYFYDEAIFPENQ